MHSITFFSYLWFCIRPDDGYICPKHVTNCCLQIKLCLGCGSSFIRYLKRHPVHIKVILKYRISWCIRSVKSLEEEINEYFVPKAVHVQNYDSVSLLRSKTTSYTSENTVIFNKPVRLHVVLHRSADWRTKQLLEVLFESVICLLSHCGTHVTTQHNTTRTGLFSKLPPIFSVCHIIALNKFIRRKKHSEHIKLAFFLITFGLFQFIAIFFNILPFFIALYTYISFSRVIHRANRKKDTDVRISMGIILSGKFTIFAVKRNTT